MRLSYRVYMLDSPMSSKLPPIILLHSEMESKRSWVHVAGLLSEATLRKVYAFDFRNHGESPRDDDHTCESLAKDLNVFMVHHRMQKAVLVGHSMGGMVAMLFATQQPQKVEKLIIEDTRIAMTDLKSTDLIPTLISSIKAFQGQANYPDKKTAEEEIVSFFKTLSPLTKIPEEAIDKYRRALTPSWDGKHVTFKVNIDAVEKAVNAGSLFPEITGVYDGETLFFHGAKSQFKIMEWWNKNKNSLGVERVKQQVHVTSPLTLQDLQRRITDDCVNVCNIKFKQGSRCASKLTERSLNIENKDEKIH